MSLSIGNRPPDLPGTSRSPFHDIRPAVLIAAAYAAAIAVWLVGGDALPGGRWLVVHLFTLGVLSNLVAALTVHFAETLLHYPSGGRPTWRTALFNAGVLGVIAGMIGAGPWVVAVGATGATVAVFHLYRQLRTIRKRALTRRFAFAVRAYERACGAFLHGALLGALLGAGILPGSWAVGARLAHLHTNVLGWGGLTLLATLVMFGPTVLRTRMAEGADDRAARWLPRGATGLTVGVLALIVSGQPGVAGALARVIAAAGLGVYGVVLPVRRRSANGLLMAGACLWLPMVVAGDVVAVLTQRWWVLNLLGVVTLAGVLGQAIVASVGYVGPLLWDRADARPAVRSRMERLPVLRMVVFNLGVAGLAAASVTALPAALGGALIAGVVVAHVAGLTWPPRPAVPHA